MLPFDHIGDCQSPTDFTQSTITNHLPSAQPSQNSVDQSQIEVVPPSGVQNCVKAQLESCLNRPPIKVAIIGHSTVRDLQREGLKFNEKYPGNPCEIKFLAIPDSTFSDWNSAIRIAEIGALFPNSQLDCIVVLLGGNDFTQDNLAVEPGNNPLYKIYNQIREFFYKLHSNFPDAKIINVPIENRFYRDQFNNHLCLPIALYRTYAKRVNKFIKGKKIVDAIVCVWSERGGIDHPSYFQPDGVHLNFQGLIVMSKQICFAIRNLFFPNELKFLE